MMLFKKIIDFYVDSSIHVALAAYAFIRMTMLLLNISYDESVACFGFYGTITAYNCIKYFLFFIQREAQITIKLKLIFVISLISCSASIYYYFQLETISKLLSLFAFCIALIYGFSLFGGLKAARNWIGFKVFLVVFSWTIITFLLPVVNAKLEFTQGLFLCGIQRFVLIYALMCVFEIVDLQFDAISLQTIPQRIGVKQTKLVGFTYLILYLILEFFKTNQFILIDLFFVGLIGTFICFSSRNRSKYYSNFWVESIPIFWWLILLLFVSDLIFPFPSRS
ncbi:MAG TPA: hypothetical protein VK164_00210 [Flavobacterium sp.]|uniref:hypothetical protein n=1 Tax=Flavobacterium sp. TaxID=239 RepID=UPI002B4B1D66|nr:hypothetical protein [Flavobacterium sp.]HLO72338.1 hypothetical protein [Flavobacterium sp.]